MAYYGGGPAEWAAMQQNQRQQQINNILQMFVAMKQHQEQQAWKQKEWENQLQQQAFSRPLEERRVKAYETMAGASGQSDFDARFKIGKSMGMDDIQATAFARGEKTPDQIREEAKARAEGTAAGTPPKPEMTPYQRKMDERDARNQRINSINESITDIDAQLKKANDKNYIGPPVNESVLNSSRRILAKYRGKVRGNGTLSEQEEIMLRAIQQNPSMPMTPGVESSRLSGTEQLTPSPNPGATPPTPQKDQWGTVGEVRVSPKDKKPYRYLGNNQWEPVS
jgi:hypothetical protein